jgi:hypothetical protein
VDPDLRRGDGLISFGTTNSFNPVKSGIQIQPMPVVTLNQVDLPVALPFLDLLLASDRSLDTVVHFVPYELVHRIFGCEAWNYVVLVLPDSFRESRRDADIECSSHVTSEQVDVELFHRRHCATRATSFGRRPVSTFPILVADR